MKFNRERVLVIGATGYIGRFIIAELKSKGCIIRAVVRDRQRALGRGSHGAPALEGLVDEWIISPDGPQEPAPECLDSVDRVVSALGVTRQKADPWDVDFRMNLAYLSLAERQQVKSFLYVGVVRSFSGTSAVARAKHAFIEVLRRSSVAAQIVNPSGYFSDLTEVLDMARYGLAIGIGDGSTLISPIHGADLADFCVRKISDHPGEWDVGGPETMTYNRVIQMAFSVLNKKERYLHVPVSLSRPSIWVADRISPRAGSLTRFFIEGMQTDASATPYGTRTLGDYYRELVVEKP